MSKAKAEELGLEWLAEIGASGQVAGPDSTLQMQPANAIKAAADKEGIAVSDIDLFELNEAFAAVGIESARALGVGDDVKSTSTVARSHWATRSGCRVRGSCCTWPTNSSAEAVAPARPCVVAVARATR
jgi:acetyl-CoA C-acetyltransferase